MSHLLHSFILCLFSLLHSSLPVSKIIRIVQLNDPVRGQNQTDQDEGEEL